jgi:predicted acyl esterase
MSDDQRFAARRPDVLVHQSAPLEGDLTLAGPVKVSLDVSTTGTDGDFIVKLIDVYPGDMPSPDPNPREVHLPGYQQLVRAEVFRGRFRSGFDKPSPFVPGAPSTVSFTLPDVDHTWRSSHRLMIQVQSTWFPLVELNPQTYVDIATAKASDFVPATITLDRAKTSVTLPVRRGTIP